MLARFVSLLTIAYAGTLIVATHLPPTNSIVVSASRAPDKFWHFVAYAVLAIFAYATDVFIRPHARNRLLPLMGFLLAFAICDEVTQPFFGRNTEVMDLIFDLGGAVCGLAIATGLWRFNRWPGFQPNGRTSDA